MDTDLLQSQTRLLVSQKITVAVNRYVVTAGHAQGSGETVAFVEQARFKLRDESKRERLFAFKARQVFDIGASYDVFTPDGVTLGAFRKDALRSLLSSTWRLEPAGATPAVGSERNALIAILRRIQDTIPLPYHFDFTRDGQPVMSVDRRLGIRDRYVVEIHDPGLDRRLAIAQAVALDAMQAR